MEAALIEQPNRAISSTGTVNLVECRDETLVAAANGGSRAADSRLLAFCDAGFGGGADEYNKRGIA
jgi:hypothetical protein